MVALPYGGLHKCIAARMPGEVEKNKSCNSGKAISAKARGIEGLWNRRYPDRLETATREAQVVRVEGMAVAMVVTVPVAWPASPTEMNKLDVGLAVVTMPTVSGVVDDTVASELPLMDAIVLAISPPSDGVPGMNTLAAEVKNGWSGCAPSVGATGGAAPLISRSLSHARPECTRTYFGASRSAGWKSEPQRSRGEGSSDPGMWSSGSAAQTGWLPMQVVSIAREYAEVNLSYLRIDRDRQARLRGRRFGPVCCSRRSSSNARRGRRSQDALQWNPSQSRRPCRSH